MKKKKIGIKKRNDNDENDFINPNPIEEQSYPATKEKKK
jgi:hypothetical protein